MTSSFRVMLIANAYAPYRVPAWKALARRVDHLEIVLLTEREENRIWKVKHEEGYSYRILSPKGLYIPWMKFTFYFGEKIWKTIQEYSPTHILLGGFHQVPFLKAIAFARLKKLPLVQWYESHALSSRYAGGIVHWGRKLVLRQADAWVAPGLMTQAYLEQMGIPNEKIFSAPNVVDVSVFGEQRIPPRSGKCRFLYVGRFVSFKGLDLLLDAFQRFPEDQATLRIIGHGPMEAHLKERIRSMMNAELFGPTTSPEETARHYAWADAVLVPSYIEPWGLVVNEALATGCYVLASSRAGVTPDLVLDAPLDVGRAIDPIKGVDALAEDMEYVLRNQGDIRSRRGAIRQWGLKFTPERWAEGVCNALELASKQRSG